MSTHRTPSAAAAAAEIRKILQLFCRLKKESTLLSFSKLVTQKSLKTFFAVFETLNGF